MLGQHKFKVGQRCHLSQYGRDRNLGPKTRRFVHGVITKVDEFNSPSVKWDNRRTASSYHPDFIEPDPPLTRAQLQHLQAAERNRGRLTWGGRSNAGGSLRRMCNQLVVLGLLSGPPYMLTEAARAVLKARGGR